MSDDSPSGRVFGVPYNFELPTPRRLLSGHWRPGEGALVENPFGVGWTLNLANPRSWLVLAVVLLAAVGLTRIPADDDPFPDDDPVEIDV